ncbi:MAG: hypothetical protein DRR16_24425 [Candidatus Parabeggiatoa sp. nov. 3]|nr:MAG: hypothetical protein DRR00_16860 [Gammaproteobacteria bacterium]RKZ67983.1 MAG: hypothetical protein DRQ99_05180 [Gammaproteobacteria bacterium]RKZ80129.1 MAG: hypothetical protein DRR16_24425 [Gammaproteobacteria bacterium]HEW97616.1 tetratricopeptide repeat protein [Beggiatoa sp.]
MKTQSIFISHATQDDDFVKQLRLELEHLALTVWVDSRNLRGGKRLAPEIKQAIENARQVLVVLSPNTINSPWVRKEIALAVERELEEKTELVIPLLLPGVLPAALDLWFDEPPLAIPIQLKPAGLREALPAILAALGERLPDDQQPLLETEAQPVAELLLKLKNLHFQELEGKRRAKATAMLIYTPAHFPLAREVESPDFYLTAALGPIEADDLQWYLEQYHIWPMGGFKDRALRIEAQLPLWGQALFQAVFDTKATQAALQAWEHAALDAERRFSLFVDRQLPEGSETQAQALANEAASEWLRLPWELLHDGRGYLFQGKQAVRVRRRLPNYHDFPVRFAELPIRILLVSPRPDDKQAGYLDHRASALPLVEAMETLGDQLVNLTLLTPPTFPALQLALQNADARQQPFDVVHFDGHGVFDHVLGLGGLCFESPKTVHQLEHRATAFVDAKEIAAVIRDYRIPLVFLDACQTAKSETDPTASVAAQLLEEGTTSVVAMSYTVFVATAQRFVKAFYHALAQGARVGQAMLAGQQALKGDSYRFDKMGSGEFHLQDWFVPVLFQERHDPQLFTRLPPQAVQQLQQQQRRLSLGALPESPPHTFIGRSRDLLKLERLLAEQPYAVVRGSGGAGKTTLAVELARWLVRTERFQRAAFVSLEEYSDARGLLDQLGRQVLPDGDHWSVATYPDLKQAIQPVVRALSDHKTLIVLDNLESVLAAPTGGVETREIAAIWQLCQSLLNADPATRIVLTSREPLPAPFDHKGREIQLGALSKSEAIELVREVMRQEGRTPKESDPGTTPQEIKDLVEAVHCHARALVLLAREVSRRGVCATTETLQHIMADLHQKYPDDRENSLYASVELSLRRLSPETREKIRGLAVCHGGVHFHVLYSLSGKDEDTATRIFKELIDVGLAEEKGYEYLSLDPALPTYLRREMDTTEQTQFTEQWADAMRQLVDFLYKQQFKDAQLSAQLTLLELPNLMALLAWIPDKATPEKVVNLAGNIEQLLARLNHPQALAQAIAVREQAKQSLTGWSRAQFQSERLQIERLLDKWNLPAAYTAAQALWQHSVEAGEKAYPDADYDMAMAYKLLGQVLNRGGQAEAALQPLNEAQQRFQQLADTGNQSAERMASGAIMERGDCLIDLGQLEEAATAYQTAIQLDEKQEDARSVAVGKGQLGTVRLKQKRYDDALEHYTEAKTIVEALGEWGSVASAWHQIGMVHKEAKQFEVAEQAYRQSLAICVQLKNKAGEASSLGEVGNLYLAMERLEEAVVFFRQAADIHVELKNMKDEGSDRNNLAHTLIKLHRYDEARRELQRGLECLKPFGHAATPWKAWAILYVLEQATNHPQAAAEARQQAIERFMAYRRASGENYSGAGQLCLFMAQAMRDGKISEAEQELAKWADHPEAKLMISKLQAILKGDRNPKLADDAELSYNMVVELRLLLESLQRREYNG